MKLFLGKINLVSFAAGFVMIITAPVTLYAAVDSQAAGPLVLQELILKATETNPQILSARAKRRAAKAAILSAWDLKNPQATYEFMGKDLQTRVGPREQMFGISQMIPFFSKLPLRTQAAVIAEKIAGHYILHVRQAVRTQVMKAYGDLLASQKQLRILENELNVLGQISSHVRSGVATGANSASDTAKIEAETAKVTERMLETKLFRTQAEERLNVAIGTHPSADWPEIDVPDLPGLALNREELKELALRHHHGLNIQKLLIDQKDVKVALAKMEYLPDFEVAFNYVQIGDGTSTRPDDGQDAWSIPLTVSIPLWEPQLHGRVQEAEHDRRSASQELEHLRNETLAAVSESYMRYQTSFDRMRVYQTTWIPQAEQAYTSTVAGFEGGSIPILEVLDSLRMKLEAEIGYWQSFADTVASCAMVEQIIGFPLDQISKIQSHEHYFGEDNGDSKP